MLLIQQKTHAVEKYVQLPVFKDHNDQNLGKLDGFDAQGPSEVLGELEFSPGAGESHPSAHTISASHLLQQENKAVSQRALRGQIHKYLKFTL